MPPLDDNATPALSRAGEIERQCDVLVDLALAEAAALIRAAVPNAAAITTRVWQDFVHLFAVHPGAAPVGRDLVPDGAIIANSDRLPLREITDLLSLARACGLDPAARGWRRAPGRRVWWVAELAQLDAPAETSGR